MSYGRADSVTNIKFSLEKNCDCVSFLHELDPKFHYTRGAKGRVTLVGIHKWVC